LSNIYTGRSKKKVQIRIKALRIHTGKIQGLAAEVWQAMMLRLRRLQEMLLLLLLFSPDVRRLSPRPQLRMKARPQSTEDQMLMRWNFAVVILFCSIALPCWGFSFAVVVVVEIVFP